MNDILVALAALMPALIILAYIFFRDKNRREPIGQIWKGVRYGLISVLVTFALCIPFSLLQEFVPMLDQSVSLLGSFYNAFFVAAIPEELAKLLMLYLMLRKNPYFDERMDGIVYAVAVGMGFAGLENVLYLYDNMDNLAGVGIIRALFAVPGHFCYAVFMGYYYSLAHFDGKNNRSLNLFLMLAVPIVLHGCYDLLLMSFPHLHPFFILLGFAAFLGLCIGMNIVAHIKIRHHLKADAAMMADAERKAKAIADIMAFVEAMSIVREKNTTEINTEENIQSNE